MIKRKRGISRREEAAGLELGKRLVSSSSSSSSILEVFLIGCLLFFFLLSNASSFTGSMLRNFLVFLKSFYHGHVCLEGLVRSQRVCLGRASAVTC